MFVVRTLWTGADNRQSPVRVAYFIDSLTRHEKPPLERLHSSRGFEKSLTI